MKMTLVNTPDFAMLPVEERKSVLDWQEAMEAVDRADSKFAECRRQATLHPGVKGWKSPRAIQKKYYAWINAGKSWTVLVNWAKVPRMAGPRDDALGNAYKAYAERNQRSGRQGHAALLRDLRSGKHIEGVGTWEDVWRAKYPRSPLPMRCPADWTPPGWHYENLQRKYPLSSYERANATRGAVAARQFAPPVYSTRVGMPVGAEYQFDDMWDDLVVSVPGVNSKLVRPLQFRCIDRASTHLVSWGVKPQILRDDQSREGLGKALFKATVADVLCNQGFRPKDAGGTVFVIEHGTASLSEDECALVTRLTDGAVTFRRSDVLGKQVNDGVFPGQGHGNFRAKALLESLHRLPHFAAAALPGQVGSVSQHGMGVESLYGLEKYANRLLAAYERIPAAIRNQVSFGGALPFACYRVLMAELYELIDTRSDHKMEGWDENGWIKELWSFDGVTDWRPAEAIATLHPSARPAAQEMLRTPGHHKGVRLSPREVWEAGAGALVRLPHCAVVDFLGEDCYRTVRVGRRHLIEFQDRDIFGTSQTMRYVALLVQPDGTGVWLREGAEYGLYTLPHNPAQSVVVDPVRRNVLGMVSQWTSVQPMNEKQVEAAIASQNTVRAMLNDPIRERHAEAAQIALSEQQNNSVILEGVFEERKDGVLVPSKEKAKPLPGAGEAERQRRQSIRAATAALFKTEPEKQGEEYDGSETGW